MLLTVVALVACRDWPGAGLPVNNAERVTSEDGVTICYEVQGQGPQALVFVHGWSCDRSYWDEQRDFFSQRFTVVTVDLGGHGCSGSERDIFSMSAFGADVAAVIEELDLRDVILVGHSMGGAVNIEAARRVPGRIRALVGVDTYQNLEHRYDASQIRQFLAPFKADFAGTTKAFVHDMFPPGADPALVEKIAADMAAAPEAVALSAFEELFRYDPSALMAKLPWPVRCINSDMFETNVGAGKRVAESFEVKIVQNVGHFVHLEVPETFNRLLQDVTDEFWGE